MFVSIIHRQIDDAVTALTDLVGRRSLRSPSILLPRVGKFCAMVTGPYSSVAKFMLVQCFASLVKGS